MTDMERLAIAQAMYKAIGEIVSTKDPDSLRSQVGARLLREYEEDGTKQKAMRVNGHEVGLLYVSQAQPKERIRAEIADADALWDFAADDVRDFIADSGLWEDFALWLRAQGYGSKSLPGASFVTVAEQKPPATVLKVEPEKVAAALGEGLPDAVMGLIGAGEDG